jgi:hypothetical protein
LWRRVASDALLQLLNRFFRQLLGQRAQRVEHGGAVTATRAAVTLGQDIGCDLVNCQTFGALRVHGRIVRQTDEAVAGCRFLVVRTGQDPIPWQRSADNLQPRTNNSGFSFAADAQPVIALRNFQVIEPLPIARQQLVFLAAQDAGQRERVAGFQA